MKTIAVEDYLKAICEISRMERRVSTTAVAERLSVAPASVTGMIKKLSAMKLITHEPYQGVELTHAGRKMALEVIRHHRLVELYLAEALGVPWDQVHEEAEKWEHVLSEDLEDRIDAVLGHPKVDPHGAPIPDRDGVMAESETRALSQLQPGERALVAEVNDEDPALLRYLGELGLYPGVNVEILSVEPFRGPIRLQVEGAEHNLGQEAAEQIFVSKIGKVESEVEQVR